MSTSELVRLGGTLAESDRARVGGKALGLAALLRAGLSIPDTWVLPVGAVAEPERLTALTEHSDRWAVRSSADVEDGAALSYAGMFRSELDVPVENLPAAIARVQASARSSRVAAYRMWTGAGSRQVGMAVLLQPYRTPVCSGLWLGRGLATGRLEWIRGSGEALVSGAVIPAWEEWASTGYVDGSHGGVLATGSQAVGEACVAVQRAFGAPADLEFAILDTGPTRALRSLDRAADPHGRRGGAALPGPAGPGGRLTQTSFRPLDRAGQTPAGPGGRLLWLQFRPMTTRIGAPARQDVPGNEDVVQGIPASSGQAVGTAIWPHDTDDTRWRPGAVLLAEQTDPDWVPLMAEAAALVTAAGGMLCHAAIVARELGVPCVTGVGISALRRLSRAGTLAVDGTAGTVSVVPTDTAGPTAAAGDV